MSTPAHYRSTLEALPPRGPREATWDREMIRLFSVACGLMMRFREGPSMMRLLVARLAFNSVMDHVKDSP